MMLLLINYLHEKASQKVKTDEIDRTRAICNLHSCYMNISPVFSPSEARHFSIITPFIQ